MDSLMDFFLHYGYWGMFLASFVAGSFFPFSSEAVMTGLSVAGLKVVPLVIYSTIGNTLGGYFNYGVGRLGHEDWIYRMLKVKPERLEKSRQLVQRYGVWMGLLSWLPILGSVITIAMGLLRTNPWMSALSIFLGKALRYVALGWVLWQF